MPCMEAARASHRGRRGSLVQIRRRTVLGMWLSLLVEKMVRDGGVIWRAFKESNLAADAPAVVDAWVGITFGEFAAG